ncbi:uncharacterized protein MELLADRAFT_115817 [Melampsora larici-populina 98AG31]|uniref:Uncharacterized protein n=1 Tax=Melampsora larici-populina (strain 98AG31 / pathotype 3-4-7) TaxID=747676 RepID=F4REI0_MELLP|nr:uncharacterized protein MELLADRAFT_115817 [Melampsora larici-populina 98AG31]EGG09267.1 hypothetical protein MELLADRAFT_115817 [Melampsora larici-populina 98AG31]
MDPWSTNEWEEPTVHHSSSIDKSSSTLDFNSSIDLPSTFPTSSDPQTSWPSDHNEYLNSWESQSIPKKPSLSSLEISHSSPALHSIGTQPSDSPVWPSTVELPDFNHVTGPQDPLAIESQDHTSNLPKISSHPEDFPETSLNLSFSASEQINNHDTRSEGSNEAHPTPRSELQDPEDNSWGEFNSETFQATFPAPKIDSPVIPTADAWHGNTTLAEWEPPPLPPPPTLSLNSIIPHQETTSPGWEPSDEIPNQVEDEDEDGTEMGEVIDAWADNKQRGAHQVPSETVAKFQVDTRKWATEQYPIQEENFLPAGKAAMTLDLSAAMVQGGELAEIVADLSQPPLPETSEISTQKLFQNSAISNAFQSAINQTASSAASVLKSASRPRRLFPSGSLTTFTKNSTSESGQASDPTNDDAIWNNFSALEVPHHPHDQKTDAFGLHDAKQSTQPQNKPAGFFSRWTGQAPLTTNTPATLLTKKPDNVLIDSISPLSDSRHSTPNLSEAALPSPSSASMQEASSSRLSRLFGRFGTRPKDSPTSDSNSAISAVTELNDRDVAFLDSVKTVPFETKPALYDEFDNLQIGKQDKAHDLKNPRTSMSSVPPIYPAKPKIKTSYSDGQEDLLDFLAQGAPTKTSPSKSPSKVLKFSPNSITSSSSKQNDQDVDPFDVFNTAPISNSASSKSSRPNSFGQFQGQHSSFHISSSMSSSSKPGSHTKSFSTTSKVPQSLTRYDDIDDLFSEFESVKPTQSRRQSSSTVVPKQHTSTQSWSTQSNHTIPTSQPSQSTFQNMNQSSQLNRIPKMAQPNARTPTPILHLTPNSTNSNVPVPILRPPPSGSSPIPLIAPPSSKLGILSPPAPPSSNLKILSPPPLPSSSSSSSSRPMMSSSFVSKPNGKLNHQTTQSGGLSKQDLSFFDSLL